MHWTRPDVPETSGRPARRLLYLRPCAHPGCPDLAGADLDGNPPPLSYGWDKGEPLYCWYHASPMWVKRRQRAKAKRA
jgi:hypothetical protein